MSKLSAAELAKREDVIQKMKKNKRSLVKRYGSDAEKVMYGRATNIAKKVAETQMEKTNLKELVRAALMQEKKFPDLTGDGKVTKADILKARGVELDEGLAQAVVLTDKDHENLMKNGSVAVNVGGQTIIVSLKDFDVDMEDYEDSSLEEIGMFHDPRGYDKNAASEDKKALQLIDAMIKKGVDKETAIEKVADKFNLRTSYLQRKMGEGDLSEDLDLAEITPAQQKYVDKAANKPSKPVKTQFRKDIEAAKRAMDAGRATDDEIIKKYGIEAFNAVNAENEYLEEDLDLGHEDNEPHMIKGELYRIGKYAMELYQMVGGFEEMGGEVDFPAWWQSKITTAMNNMVSAKHYLDFETKEPEIDAAVDVIDASDALDNVEEGLPKGYFKKATAELDEEDNSQSPVGMLNRLNPNRSLKVGDITTLSSGKHKGKKVKISKDLNNGRFEFNFVKEELDESFEKLVGKLKKGGKSEKAAKAIAGAVASYKAKGGGKGPTAKQKARE